MPNGIFVVACVAIAIVCACAVGPAGAQDVVTECDMNYLTECIALYLPENASVWADIQDPDCEAAEKMFIDWEKCVAQIPYCCAFMDGAMESDDMKAFFVKCPRVEKILEVCDGTDVAGGGKPVAGGKDVSGAAARLGLMPCAVVAAAVAVVAVGGRG